MCKLMSLGFSVILTAIFAEISLAQTPVPSAQLTPTYGDTEEAPPSQPSSRFAFSNFDDIITIISVLPDAGFPQITKYDCLNGYTATKEFQATVPDTFFCGIVSAYSLTSQQATDCQTAAYNDAIAQCKSDLISGGAAWYGQFVSDTERQFNDFDLPEEDLCLPRLTDTTQVVSEENASPLLSRALTFIPYATPAAIDVAGDAVPLSGSILQGTMWWVRVSVTCSLTSTFKGRSSIF
jgi:hypothetical protein